MIAFSGSPLDRASARRADAAWLAEQRAHRSARILPLWQLRPFVLGAGHGPQQAGFVIPAVAESMAGPDAPWVLLGLDGEAPLFALDISAAADPQTQGPLAGLGHFEELRGLALRGSLAPAELAICGQAKAMIDWHLRHGFCARCGAPTALVDGGWRRRCAQCGADHFPRTDPVVIMLASAGERCLVGRGRHFPAGMFSALAGFLEPGETIEEGVRREILEEAGIVVGAVRYLASQPWAFPSSLMIGCLAEAKSEHITLGDDELAEARWLERDEVRALLGGSRREGLFLPPPMAIAHHLLRAWAFDE
ncbi:MAG: NAD(+) diphosphatase [Alphaproteobacteria bacterium]|nr:NAD(+) diphosphatase [Alphaproteobacteria bacterium]